MKFPEWIDDPKFTDGERASNRLRYLIANVGAELTGRGTLRAVAKLAGVDHSTLAYSIKRGSCTAQVALQIEEAIGRQHIRHEHLRRPLEITE
jgi:hypothetical protein